MICRKCGNIRFYDADTYRSHIIEIHQKTVQLKAYNFTGRSKSAIVEEKETDIRNKAWHTHKLNPLIGMTNDSVEPTWDNNMELV